MSHQRQAKRPYAGSQPSITSYFLSTSNINSPSYSISPIPAIDSRNPPLPAAIQANLLSVGMRVRKSVPEGYKTGSYSAFTLFSDPSLPPGNRQIPVTPETGGNKKFVTRPRARELTPFCGILKVGGLAQQEELRDDEDDEIPFLNSQGSTVFSSSVDSVSSTQFGGPSGNKRRFDEEPEENNVKMNVGFTRRVIAVPRSKKIGRRVGQENLGEGDDFEDAEFLDYGLVGEVEMGGV